MDKDKLIEILKDGEATVTFRKKKSDEIRVMKCTLNEALIPPQKKSAESKIKKPDYLIVVWDLENEGWRSFDIDLVQTVEN